MKVYFSCILCILCLFMANDRIYADNIVPNILTPLLLDPCDGTYVYDIIYTGEDKLWKRTHCKDGYVHELGQVKWISKSYDYWVFYKIYHGGELKYRLGQWEAYWVYAMGFDDWKYTEFYEKSAKTMECYEHIWENLDSFPPVGGHEIRFRRIINGFWVSENVSSYEACLSIFSSYLPTTPVSIYIPGDCHEWWDHGTETCNP